MAGRGVQHGHAAALELAGGGVDQVGAKPLGEDRRVGVGLAGERRLHVRGRVALAHGRGEGALEIRLDRADRPLDRVGRGRAAVDPAAHVRGDHVHPVRLHLDAPHGRPRSMRPRLLEQGALDAREGLERVGARVELRGARVVRRAGDVETPATVGPDAAGHGDGRADRAQGRALLDVELEEGSDGLDHLGVGRELRGCGRRLAGRVDLDRREVTERPRVGGVGAHRVDAMGEPRHHAAHRGPVRILERERAARLERAGEHARSRARHREARPLPVVEVHDGDGAGRFPAPRA